MQVLHRFPKPVINRSFIRKHKRKSLYYDGSGPTSDNNNRSFFIFHLGSYRNKQIYYYGETYDIDLTELHLRQCVPFYKNILDIPVGDAIYGSISFESYIRSKKIRAPCDLLEPLDYTLFSPQDDEDLLNIVKDCKMIFKVDEDE